MMNTEELFTTNRVVNYFLINVPDYCFIKTFLNKWSATIVLLLSALLRLIWWFSQLKRNKAACSTEIIAGFIHVLIYAMFTILSAILYTLNGTKKLKALLAIINQTIQSLNANFKLTIFLTRQQLAVKYSVISLSIYAFGFLIHGYYLEENDTIFLVSAAAATILVSWLRFFIFIELIFLSILVNEIEALRRVNFKWDYRYANLCVDIYEQSTLINNLFGFIALTIMVENFGDILLTMWSASNPHYSCIMLRYQYLLFVCCIWNIAIIESGQRVKNEVRIRFSNKFFFQLTRACFPRFGL